MLVKDQLLAKGEQIKRMHQDIDGAEAERKYNLELNQF